MIGVRSMWLELFRGAFQMSLDARDVRILRSIAENDSTSPERIQEETNIPKSTVHYRIKNMKDRGVIKNDLFEIDFEKAGLGLTVISEVLAEFGEGYQEEVGKALAEIEGVNEVYFMMGDTDFIVISRLPSRDMVETLVEEFEAVDGIQRTSSKFVISSIKADESVGILRDYSEETLLNSHGLDETVEKLSDLLCSIRRRRKGRADYTLATKRKCWTGRLRASPCQCDVGCVESLRRPAVRGAAIGVMLLDREAAWRQYQHRSGRRGRTLKTAVFVGTGSRVVS